MADGDPGAAAARLRNCLGIGAATLARYAIDIGHVHRRLALEVAMSDSRRSYPSDLSDAEWELLAPLLAPASQCGRPRKWPIRHVTDAIFYVLRSTPPQRRGCIFRSQL